MRVHVSKIGRRGRGRDNFFFAVQGRGYSRPIFVKFIMTFFRCAHVSELQKCFSWLVILEATAVKNLYVF